MWNAEFKLYLYPNFSPNYPDIADLKEFTKDTLATLLSKQEFTGKQISSQPVLRYATGEKFLSQLTFMGCSPNIELEPQENKPHCYIEIGQHKQPLFISGKNLKKAKCPHCKFPIDQPECSNCHKEIKPQVLNWRKTAFFASIWISIANIYESEAIPNDNLITSLENHTDVKWKYAYIRRHTSVI